MANSHLVLGGARSGKSTFAENLASDAHEAPQALIYVATATAGDAEMQQRIGHHQARRDHRWQTIEEPTELAKVISSLPPSSVVLIDCLTLWLSNCLHQGCWTTQKSAFIDALKSTDSSIIMVSNEVGSGIVPMGQLSRTFVDESGWLHQELAQICDRVTLVVAGLPMPLKSS